MTSTLRTWLQGRPSLDGIASAPGKDPSPMELRRPSVARTPSFNDFSCSAADDGGHNERHLSMQAAHGCMRESLALRSQQLTLLSSCGAYAICSHVGSLRGAGTPRVALSDRAGKSDGSVGLQPSKILQRPIASGCAAGSAVLYLALQQKVGQAPVQPQTGFSSDALRCLEVQLSPCAVWPVHTSVSIVRF